MTVRPGQYGLTLGISQTLGSGTGRIYALNNSAWAILNNIRVLLTTTATVGNRVLVVRITDSNANIIGEGVCSAALAASVAWKVNFGAGSAILAASTFATGQLPVEMPIAPSALCQIFDAVNTDVADTIQPNFLFAM